VNAEVTLLEHAGDRIGESDIVWAGCSTIVTTDTAVGINHYNAVLAFISSPHRAYRITDRALTMVTQPGQEKRCHPGISSLFRALAVRTIPGQGDRGHLRVCPLLNDSHPNFPDTERHFVFGLTSHLAGMTSHTSPEVDDHSPSHFFLHEDVSFRTYFTFGGI
jgi:hypothetical protein